MSISSVPSVLSSRKNQRRRQHRDYRCLSGTRKAARSVRPDPQHAQQFLSAPDACIHTRLNIFVLACAVVTAHHSHPVNARLQPPSADRGYRCGWCSAQEQCGYSSAGRNHGPAWCVHMEGHDDRLLPFRVNSAHQVDREFLISRTS